MVLGASSESTSSPNTESVVLDYCLQVIRQGAWCSVLGCAVQASLAVQAMPTKCMDFHLPQCKHRSLWLFALKLPPM